jgi:RNA polymerase sigma-70 factor, ECF subfamily
VLVPVNTVDTFEPGAANIFVSEHDVTHRMPDDVRLQALMVSYQAGDLAAFDQIYSLLAGPIRGYLRRRSTPELLSDLVQDTFLQIHRARHTYDPAYPVAPWAFAIARHVWLMHCRATGRRPRVTDAIDDVPLTVRADAEAFADRAIVREALAGLAPERRRPLVWHHVLGFSFREIAKRLGIREDAAKLRSSRAMAELRATLSDKDPRKKERND